MFVSVRSIIPEVLHSIEKERLRGFLIPLKDTGLVGNRIGDYIRYESYRRYCIVRITSVGLCPDFIEAFYKGAAIGILPGFTRDEFVRHYNRIYRYPWEAVEKYSVGVSSQYIRDMGGCCVIRFEIVEKIEDKLDPEMYIIGN